jgi:hypothetical protein
MNIISQDIASGSAAYPSLPVTSENISEILQKWTVMPISSVDEVTLSVTPLEPGTSFANSNTKTAPITKRVDLKILVNVPFVVKAESVSLAIHEELTPVTIDSNVAIGFHSFDGNLPPVRGNSKFEFIVPVLGTPKSLYHTSKPLFDYISLAKSPVVHQTLQIPGRLSNGKSCCFRIRYACHRYRPH